jgi:nucleoside-diphosphate-sugar epimerase
MKFMIIGGPGFIECHLAEALVKLNHKVIILDNFFIENKKNLKKIINKITIVLGRNIQTY